jgi:hypothetical protein
MRHVSSWSFISLCVTPVPADMYWVGAPRGGGGGGGRGRWDKVGARQPPNAAAVCAAARLRHAPPWSIPHMRVRARTCTPPRASDSRLPMLSACVSWPSRIWAGGAGEEGAGVSGVARRRAAAPRADGGRGRLHAGPAGALARGWREGKQGRAGRAGQAGRRAKRAGAPVTHVAEDLGVAVGVGREAGAPLDQVVVHHPQAAVVGGAVVVPWWGGGGGGVGGVGVGWGGVGSGVGGAGRGAPPLGGHQRLRVPAAAAAPAAARPPFPTQPGRTPRS